MKTIAKYNMGGISFFIPCDPNAECEFLKDVIPVNEPEKGINEEAEQHDDWYNNEHAFDEINHIPETYK